MTPNTVFKDDLLSGLLQEHAYLTERDSAAAPSETAVAASSPSGRHARRGQLPIRSIAAAGAAMAAAAVVVVATRPQLVAPHAPHGGAKHHHHHPAPPRPAPSANAGLPAGATAHDVVYRMNAAVVGDDAIMLQLDHAPDSQTGKPTTEEIYSQAGNDTSLTIVLDAAGHPTTGYLVTIGKQSTTSTVIDYAAHTYRTQTYAADPVSPTRAPAPAHRTLSGSAQALKEQVDAGQVTLVGPTTVRGQQAVELKSQDAQGTIITDVDPSTYLPLREIDMAPGETPSSPSAITDEYAYLPNTAANRAHLTQAGAIPTGFQQVG